MSIPTNYRASLSGENSIPFTPAASVDTSDINTALPNELSNVEQPSYHWKFYVSSDIGLNITPSVIISETGLTAFNITDVEIESVVAPNFKTKNMQGQKFTIKISEPLGMTLPDKMMAACARAGIQNFMKAPYYLSLDFIGYDPDSGAKIKPIARQWVWRINITDFASDLDETGGRHTLTGISYSDIGALDNVSLLRNPIQVDISDTEGKVGDVMTKVSAQINKAIEKSVNATAGGIVPFTVSIKDVPYRNGGVVSRPFDHKVVRDQKHKDSSRNQGKMQLSRGTDIGRIVDYLMSVSETATQMANPDGSSTEINGEAKAFTTPHRVDIEVENVRYNAATQDYVRNITFWIKGHETVRVLSSSSGADDAVQQGGAKLNFLSGQNYLKKEYQYLFTGKNTEVVDMNINLNFSFAVAQPLMQGNVTTETASSGIEYSPDDFKKQSNNEGWSKVQEGKSPLSYCAVPTNFSLPTTTTDLFSSLSNNDIDDAALTSGYLPTSFVQDGNDPLIHVNQSIEASNLRTRSVYSTMLNQLYGSMDQNLGNVELTVRGDPYWLGITNTESLEAASSSLSPNYTFGDQVFLLKFFLPQGINEEGMPILTVTDSYSGFYSVWQVVSRFNGGTFTQVLSGIRIPTMQVSKLLSGK